MATITVPTDRAQEDYYAKAGTRFAGPKVTETAVRRALVEAGHGAVATDAHGGDAWLGFWTFRASQSVIVGFGAQCGQSFRFGQETIAALCPVMLANYARTLTAAGWRVAQDGTTLHVAN